MKHFIDLRESKGWYYTFPYENKSLQNNFILPYIWLEP